jgi:hypothetical protein
MLIAQFRVVIFPCAIQVSLAARRLPASQSLPSKMAACVNNELTVEEIESMKVPGLKQFLKENEQPVSGLKPALVERAKGVLDLRADNARRNLADSDNDENNEIIPGINEETFRTGASRTGRLLTPLGKNLPDPDTLQTDWNDDVTTIPGVTSNEMYNYLVLSNHGTFDQQNLGARRAVRARVFYENRHIHSIQYHDVEQDCSHCFVQALCLPSIPTTNKKKHPDYRVWLCLSKISGRVLCCWVIIYLSDTMMQHCN